MTPFKVFVGDRYGRWTIISRCASRCHVTVWKCRCDCGTIKEVLSNSLRSGESLSCGCLKNELARARELEHGESHTRSREYCAWNNMKSRCQNKNNPGYRNYGGRGITVCARWENSFALFLKDMGRCPVGLSLGRINNDLPYRPSNCRWETKKQQDNNRRNNVLITHDGITNTRAEWARILGISHEVIRGMQRRNSPLSPLFLSAKSMGKTVPQVAAYLAEMEAK